MFQIRNFPLIEIDRCIIHDFSKNPWRCLILRRARNGQHNAGKWEFPGGKRELASDGFPEDLMREIREEASLEVRLGSHQPFFLEEQQIRKRKYRGWWYCLRWYVGYCWSGCVKIDRKEHSAYRWVTIEELEKYYVITGVTRRMLPFFKRRDNF